MPKPPQCPDCLLAHRRDLVIDCRVFEPDQPQAVEGLVWQRCELCNATYQGAPFVFGAERLCPACAAPKPKRCPECKGLSGAHESHCRRAAAGPAACARCYRPVIGDQLWRRCRGEH